MHLMLTVFLAANAATAPAPAKDDGVPGKKTFMAKCSACHGKDAKGSAAMAKMFKANVEDLDLTGPEAQKESDAALTKTINEGKNKMPSFKGKLKDAEIADVLSYVRSLQPKSEAPKADAAKPAAETK